VVAFSLVGAVGLVLLGRLVIRILFGEVWLASYPALIGLLAGIVFLSLSKILSSDLSGRGHPEYSTYAAAISLVVSIVLDLVFIPRWGIMGAAVASSIAYCLAALTVVTLFCRTTGVGPADLLIPRLEDLRYVWRHAGLLLRRADGEP
jgi:O-antigen/teichoic acid export membrane protein